jgi:Tol biopolymer transport system component
VERRSPDAPVLTASWLGTGEAVIVVAGAEAGPVQVVPRQGGRERILWTQPCTWARSDARGERIVAVTAADGSGVIVLLDALSGEATPLCTGCSGEVQPTFSPDGRALVYADRDEEGHFQLFMVRADEG